MTSEVSRIELSSSALNALVGRAAAGDRAAVEALLSTIAPAVHRFSLRMCRNVHDAEDVLQETLLSVANHLGQFEGRSTLSSWVFALTRSACARKRRGLKNRPPEGDERLQHHADPAPSPEASAAEHEMAGALSSALNRLSDDHREVILLRDIEGLSAAETAASLGLSIDAVKSRLHRAREALRSALRPLLEPAEAHPSVGCPDVVDLWSKKLEGDLSQSDCAVMEKHMAACPACGAACDALKRALLTCQRVRSSEVPPEVKARVKSAVIAWSEERRAQGR